MLKKLITLRTFVRAIIDSLITCVALFLSLQCFEAVD